jgi:hypothetical protein
MEAALAARATHIDRAALLRAAQPTRFKRTPLSASFTSLAATSSVLPDLNPLPASGLDSERWPSLASAVPVPDVSNLPSRTAIRRLHALGLRVSRAQAGEILGTEPAAGTHVTRGDTIRLKIRPKTDD